MNLIPTAKWGQSDKNVFLTFELANITNLKCEFTDKTCDFSCDSNSNHYTMTLELFDMIDPEESYHTLNNRVLNVVLYKIDCTKFWHRLLENKNKYKILLFEYR